MRGFRTESAGVFRRGLYGSGFGFGGVEGGRWGVGERARGTGGRCMMGDGGGRCEVDEEVEGRDRLRRALVGEVGMGTEKTGPRCSVVGVKRLLARSMVGVKSSGCGDDSGPAAGWMALDGSEEVLNTSKGDESLERRPREETRESFSSGEGKRGGSSGGLGWRICANEEALTGRCGGWKEEVVGDGEMSLSSAATVARRGAWAVGAGAL